jgi:two-component system sensor histidine kinase AlgZ
MAMQSFLKRNRILFLHVLFWGIYFSFFFYQISFGKGNRDSTNYARPFLDALFQVISLAGISYLNYFVLIPRFSKNRNGFRYFLELLIPLILVIGIQLFVKAEIYKDVFTQEEMFFYRTRFIISHSITVIFVIAFVAMLRFASEWFDLQARRQEVENEKLATELRFLKEQINPHFLFNTLNNLYYLAHSQSPKTPDIIAKLSQMMRYMIYESNQEKVPVEKEIEYIKSYIELEKMRLEDDFVVNFAISGDYERLRIAPFIFITFLENAFKHGVTNGKNGKITLNLRFDGNKCTYEVTNTIASSNVDAQKGIGLLNVQRRLNLIYSGKYALTIENTADVYTAKLTLEL